MYNEAYTPIKRGFSSMRGYYQGQQDYFEHTALGGYDYWQGGSLDRNATGIYSSRLYLEELDRVLSTRDSEDIPLFVYLALQHVHSPMQIPPGEHAKKQCAHILNEARFVHCTMTVAMDVLVRDSMEMLQKAGVWEDSVFVFLSDNGGYPTPTQQGSNWPLRGGKATLFEGGIRTVAFVNNNRWIQKPGRTVDSLMHAVDWFTTLGNLGGARKPSNYSIDGVDAWAHISGTNTSHPRSELLLNIDPGVNQTEGQSIPATAGIIMDSWKLIMGEQLYAFWWPERDTASVGDDAVDESAMLRGGEEKQEKKQLYLFNIEEDPNETRNLAEARPDIVQKLFKRIQQYNMTAVAAQWVPRDTSAWPRFHDGAWVPWVS
eukprot:TRINITY_DN3186_c0_g1_i2.p1 TRINITY_DN3186_c0_g1~~TRINITY_DN3186_c0_g1_i2.p1  ORF type:complete len:374 (-),score=63.56 TRINITY_DN3186_c0_g1_i2:279-1400(-)